MKNIFSCKFLVLLGLSFVLLFVAKVQAASSSPSKEDLLIKAAKEGKFDIASHLLSDPSLDVNATDNDSCTALYHACLIGNIKIVRILCRHKDIKLNLGDVYGNTALMMAAFNGHVEVVKLLLSRPDIDVNVTDRGGDSALSHANNGKHPKIAQLIQEKIDSVSGSSTSPSGSSKYNISSLYNSKWIILLVSLAVIIAIVSGIFGYMQFRKTRRSLDFGEEK